MDSRAGLHLIADYGPGDDLDGFERPHQRVEPLALRSPWAVADWARRRRIGWQDEVFSLHLDAAFRLRCFAWLASFFSNLLREPGGVAEFFGECSPAGAVLLVARPGRTTYPTRGDLQAWALLHEIHRAHGINLIDMILVSPRRHSSVAEALGVSEWPTRWDQQITLD